MKRFVLPLLALVFAGAVLQGCDNGKDQNAVNQQQPAPATQPH